MSSTQDLALIIGTIQIIDLLSPFGVATIVGVLTEILKRNFLEKFKTYNWYSILIIGITVGLSVLISVGFYLIYYGSINSTPFVVGLLGSVGAVFGFETLTKILRLIGKEKS